MTSIEVTQLVSYPVKSLKGIQTQIMQIEDRGPQFDRNWMLVDSRKRFLSQRKHPRLCLLKTQVLEEQLLTISYGAEIIKIPIDSSSANSCEVSIWSDKCTAFDVGDAAAKYFSNFLGIPCRLVKTGTNFKRPIRLEKKVNNFHEVGFADGFPFLLVSQESLESLNQHLHANILMNRFRPNIVIRGSTSFMEDRWKKIKIGNVIFHLVKSCSRCPMINIDQETSKRNKNILSTLGHLRQQKSQIYFGQNMIHANKGSIVVGDSVEILE